jgi:hypothetical protein
LSFYISRSATFKTDDQLTHWSRHSLLSFQFLKESGGNFYTFGSGSRTTAISLNDHRLGWFVRYRICQKIALDKGNMSRFMSGDCGVRLAVVDKLGLLLGLRIVADGAKRKGR